VVQPTTEPTVESEPTAEEEQSVEEQPAEEQSSAVEGIATQLPWWQRIWYSIFGH
jgi:hypothetical protein